MFLTSGALALPKLHPVAGRVTGDAAAPAGGLVSWVAASWSAASST